MDNDQKSSRQTDRQTYIETHMQNEDSVLPSHEQLLGGKPRSVGRIQSRHRF